jgi:hypothetical protein
MFVTFIEQGRTGNLIFQYLGCKLIQLKFKHIYISYEKFVQEGYNKNCIEIKEDELFPLIEDESRVLNKHIILNGYFQKSATFVKYRKELLELLDKSLDDTWKLDGKVYGISDFVKKDDNVLPISKHDIVLNIRLDDFIQLPRERSDILPPSYYIDMINRIPKTPETKIYIICDKIRYTWEKEYLDCFKHYNVVLGVPGYDGSIWSDFKIIRDCNILIHSNSTFCWIASFLSKEESKLRFIPRTRFYGGQNLEIIEATDTLLDLPTLSHHDVFNLKAEAWKKYPIYSFSYCVPDQLIVSSVPEKSTEFSEHSINKLGDNSYKFKKEDEKEYYKLYQDAKFSNTQKRGGWDALRHYEILMNGCIPIFENIESCPKLSLTTFPKTKLLEIKNSIDNYKVCDELYNITVNELLANLKLYNSSSVRAKDFLCYMNIHSSNPKILMLCGDMGVNYLREFFWIGMKNLYTEGSIEYPCLEHIYDDYKLEDFSKLHGNGFCYGGIVDHKKKKYISEDEIKKSLESKDFDIVIYGKMGPDEGPSGTFPNLPFMKEVLDSKIPIAFLYGGDEQFKISSTYNSLSSFDKRYIDHLRFHSQFGTCFVRELF